MSHGNNESNVLFSDYSSEPHQTDLISQGVHSFEADRTLQEFSSLSLQQLESDGEEEFLASTRNSANGFVTPHKQPDSSAPEQDLDAAIDNSDFTALEKLGLKLALLARMGDLAGIKRIAGQSEFTRNSFGSFKSRDENMFQGPSTSSSQFSTPETVVAVPSSPISPHLGMSEYYPSKAFENRTSFSPYITSVKSTSQGISAERILSGLNDLSGVDDQELQSALRLLSIVEPMMEAAGRRGPNSGGLTPMLRSCPNLLGLKQGILAVAQAAARITSTEKRLLELPSPCYVLGDLHGNLPDLDFFRRILWPAGPDAAAGDFLFLGDFVDRGMESLPVVAYVMAMKVLHPNKWWAIRGNHETREVNGNQAHYQDGSFLTQCLATFGESEGIAVWEAVNGYFDTLPLAASIDGAVFCVHGGIPQELCEPGSSLDLIRQVECPLRNAQDNRMVYDMLWSDPAAADPVTALPLSTDRSTMLDAQGFGLSPRGCRSFGEAAVDLFLALHRFQHVFRGHEAQKSGVGVSMRSRLTTIFSTSRDHFGSDVEATCGCVLVEKGSIHPVVRAIAPESTSSIPAAPIYYLAPTPAQQSVEVTEVPVTHYYGGRPIEHLRAIQPAPPPQPFPQYVTAQRHQWGASGWTNTASGAPTTVIHHPYPSAPVAAPGTVHFVSLSHDGRHITHQW